MQKITKQILGWASLAPSSHNSQPWRVKLLPDGEFVVQSDSRRWLPKVDPGNREVMLSIGAFWENLHQAAAALGFEARAKIIAESAKDTDILKIKLVKCPSSSSTPGSGSDSLAAMESRSTNRKKYLPKELLPSHLKECLDLLPGSLSYFPGQSEKGKWIAANLADAMRQQAFDDEKQEELAEWLRFSPSEALERGDGITAKMLGLPGILRIAWNTFMNKKSALSKIFRDGAVTAIKDQANHCAGFFAVTSEDFSVPALLRAGRESERLILKCSQLMIENHAVSQLLQESPWKEQSPDVLELVKPVQMMICVGYSRRHPAPGIRRAVEDFCTAVEF